MNTLILLGAVAYFAGVSSLPGSDIFINIDHGQVKHAGKVIDKFFRPDYHKNGTSYYKYHEEPMVWGKAKNLCHHEGAHLAVVNCEEEMDHISWLIHSHPKSWEHAEVDHCAHIGFHDLYNEGEFLTVHGTPLDGTGFYRWAKGQPENKYKDHAENCGSVFDSGHLNDIDCSLKLPFICEKEIESPECHC